MNQKGFVSIVIFIGIFAVLGISLFLLLKKNYLTNLLPSISEKITQKSDLNFKQSLDINFVLNAVAVVKGQRKIALVEPDNPNSGIVIFETTEGNSIESLKWSPDKSKMAYYLKIAPPPDQTQKGLVDCHKFPCGYELGYIDIQTLQPKTIFSISEYEPNFAIQGAVGAYTWKEDSNIVNFSAGDDLWEYDLQDYSKKLIRNMYNYGDPLNLIKRVGNHIYFSRSHSIGKLNVLTPEEITIIVDESTVVDPGWGSNIWDFSITPDGKRLIYIFNNSKDKGIKLVNLNNLEKKTISGNLCLDLHSFLRSFSQDSSMFTFYDSCDDNIALILFDLKGNILEKFPNLTIKEILGLKNIPHQEFVERNKLTYASRTVDIEALDSFSHDSKKLIILFREYTEREDKDLIIDHSFIYDTKTRSTAKFTLLKENTTHATSQAIEFAEEPLNYIGALEWSSH